MTYEEENECMSCVHHDGEAEYGFYYETCDLPFISIVDGVCEQYEEKEQT